MPSMDTTPHPLAKKTTRRKFRETLVRCCFRLPAYGIVLTAALLLGHIVLKGSRALLSPEAPFLNISFLTGKPQTLHVFEPKDQANQLEALSAERLRLREASIRQRPGVETRRALRQLDKEIRQAERELRAASLTFSDAEFRATGNKPSTQDFYYETYAYCAGGIGPAIAGTAVLVAGASAIALFLGILCAVFLSEYSRKSRTLFLVRLSILKLAGVPSIVFGLFGFGLFVHFFGWGISILSGWWTLAFMILPVIIVSSESALRAVPQSYREGALALGASKWTTIRTNVLPCALPGILASSIMGTARVAGETAPILFTAAFALRDKYPWEDLSHWSDFFFQGVMALPYHLYVVSQKLPQNDYTRDMQYGTALVFLLLVGSFALASILLRIKVRQDAD